MGKRNKRKRVTDVQSFSNVVDAEFGIPENWHEKFIQKQPLVLELGCGKGAYTTALAEIFLHKNYIGIDVKGERLWVGATSAQAKGLRNVLFLQGNVYKLCDFFEPQSIHEMWITFPDPFPRAKQAKHRLTSPRFLEQYKKILIPAGIIHLKTDDEAFFEYTIETVEKCGGKIVRALANIYQDKNLEPILQIQTHFERKHLVQGKQIFYLCFRF